MSKSFYEKEAEVSQNLLAKLALGQRIEELKKDFSGSSDYLSGVNDGMYHFMNDILPKMSELKRQLDAVELQMSDQTLKIAELEAQAKKNSND